MDDAEDEEEQDSSMVTATDQLAHTVLTHLLTPRPPVKAVVPDDEEDKDEDEDEDEDDHENDHEEMEAIEQPTEVYDILKGQFLNSTAGAKQGISKLVTKVCLSPSYDAALPHATEMSRESFQNYLRATTKQFDVMTRQSLLRRTMSLTASQQVCFRLGVRSSEELPGPHASKYRLMRITCPENGWTDFFVPRELENPSAEPWHITVTAVSITGIPHRSHTVVKLTNPYSFVLGAGKAISFRMVTLSVAQEFGSGTHVLVGDAPIDVRVVVVQYDLAEEISLAHVKALHAATASRAAVVPTEPSSRSLSAPAIAPPPLPVMAHPVAPQSGAAIVGLPPAAAMPTQVDPHSCFNHVAHLSQASRNALHDAGTSTRVLHTHSVTDVCLGVHAPHPIAHDE